MKEPTITPEIAAYFARAAVEEVQLGDGVSRAYAVGWLPSEFRDKATWTYQKETAEMLLSVLVGAGVYSQDTHVYKRIR